MCKLLNYDTILLPVCSAAIPAKKVRIYPKTWSEGINRHGCIPDCEHGGLLSDLVPTHLTCEWWFPFQPRYMAFVQQKSCPASWQTGEPTEEMPCVVLQAFCRKITVSRTTHVTDAVVQRQALVRLLSQWFPCAAFIPTSYFFFFYFRQTTLIFHKRMENKIFLTDQSRLGTNAFDWEKYFIIMPLWCRLSLLHWFSKPFLLQKEDTNHYSLS